MRQLKINKTITNRESASLDKYLQEIGREGLITAEDEVELTKKIKGEDKIESEKALDKLVRANLRFVVSVSKQYQNQGLSLPDLINEGNLGLIKAARRFDETRGFKFISYAVWWIRQSILQALADQARIVRLPLNQVGALNKMNKTFSRLEQKLEREPNAEEIADAMHIPENHVNDIQRVSGRHVSMDAPLLNSEEHNDMYDLLPNEEGGADQPLMTDALIIEIERAIEKLTPREKDVIRLYFGLNEKRCGITMEEIGAKFDLTRERVRQIKEKAIRRLRHASRSRHLRSYLG
jgi:RNA polymerase primary sigma factor